MNEKANEQERVAALDELARALLIQEHSSVRGEVLASYGYAQSIVRWTLATFAAILAAGLLATYSSDKSGNAVLVLHIVMIAFLGFVPGFVWLSGWTWLGELYRAERAGSYLRALENQVAQIPGLYASLRFQPLRWESFLLEGRRHRKPWGKQTMTYLGTAGGLFGVVTVSCLVGGIVWAQLINTTQLWSGISPGWWVAASATINAVGIGGCIVIAVRLFALGKKPAEVRRSYRRS